MRDLRDHAAQTGQSTVEFALLALAFFLTFFIVIQLEAFRYIFEDGSEFVEEV